MFKSLRCAVVFGALGLAVFACTAGSGSTGLGSSEPQKQAQITSPSSGLVVTATISAVTLGEECAASASSSLAGDCAPSAPPSTVDGGSDGGGSAKGAPGGCGGTSYCQQSNVQIAFTAGKGTQSAKVEIVSVTLLDSSNGSVVDTLDASTPQVWNGGGYVPWNQRIAPGGDLKASYQLTAPDWARMNKTSTGSTSAYARSFKLRVKLRIDGVDVLMQSTDLHQEPVFQT